MLRPIGLIIVSLVIASAVISVVLTVAGRSPASASSSVRTINHISWGIQVVNVQGCDYVVARVSSGVSIIHKQNCGNHGGFGKND